MPQQLVFGDDNAARDPLLKDCFVKPKELSDKPLIIGRWGIGKTAVLFNRNAGLTSVLEQREPKIKHLWYIGEQALDLPSLVELRSQFGADKEGFKRSLEKLWKAEIVRTMLLLLAELRGYYGQMRGPHWDQAARLAAAETSVLPVWKRLPELAGIFFQKERTAAIQRLHDDFDKILVDATLDCIQACLKDGQGFPIKPCVVVEPIDTPMSGLEDKSLAHSVITALLNTYYNHFAPSPEQYMDVQISVPWHRYLPEDVDYPQRLSSFIGRIRWNQSSLRELVNRRIEWEFRRFHRPGSSKVADAWYALFDETVVNDTFEHRIAEDSFEFVLRHTHYRARELLRLARKSVEKYAAEQDITLDQIFRGGRHVSGSTIRDSVREACGETMRGEFLPELTRRYGDMTDLVSPLFGIHLPFSLDELKRRYARFSSAEVPMSKLNSIVDQLWAAGIIGVEVAPRSEQAVDTLKGVLGRDALRTYDCGQKRMYRWYYFVYNRDESPASLLKSFEGSTNAEVGIVLHPRTFEHFLPVASRICPVGI